MVGVGTQDSLAEAYDFVADYGTTSFLMTWDRGFDSWNHFGVRGQPAFIVIGRDGAVLGGWYGPLDDAKLNEALAQG